jgi:hypothetical protein
MPLTSRETPFSDPDHRLTRRSFFSVACGATLALTTGCKEPQPRKRSPQLKEHLISSGKLILVLRAGEGGLTLVRIGNRETRLEHLAKPSPLFGISSCDQDCRSDRGLRIAESGSNGSAGSLTISGQIENLPISFTLSVTPQPAENVALLKMQLRNHGSAERTLRVNAPLIGGLATKGSTRPMMAALPQECGGVVSTVHLSADVGMPVNSKSACRTP